MSNEKDIYAKLYECKKEIGKISKDNTNPFFNSKYFDINDLLEHVEPILQKNRLLLLQPIEHGCVKSIVIDIDTGSQAVSAMEMTDISDPQKRGSEITYYRRYTLQSLLALQAEDDDGNKASTATSKPDKNEPDKWLNITVSKNSDTLTSEWLNILDGIKKGTVTSVKDVRRHYKVSKAVQAEIENELNNVNQ
jgi:hypothetical protein